MTTEEKLKYFEETSLERAREQSAKMISEYQASLDKLEKEHKEAIDRQAALKVKAEAISLKRSKNMTLSKERVEIKRNTIKKQNELKEKLSVEVKTMLENFMTTPAYQALLIEQIQDILRFADGSPVTIYIDSADRRHMSSLIAATNTPVTLSEESFLGGTRGILEDKHILIDHSFITRLDEVMEQFNFNGGNVHE